MRDQFLSLDRTCLCPLKEAALGFFSLIWAFWLTQSSLLGSAAEYNCSAFAPGSDGNIPWEEMFLWSLLICCYKYSTVNTATLQKACTMASARRLLKLEPFYSVAEEVWSASQVLVLSIHSKVPEKASIPQLPIQFTECYKVSWMQLQGLNWEGLSSDSVSKLIWDWVDRTLNKRDAGPVATSHSLPPPLLTVWKTFTCLSKDKPEWKINFSQRVKCW